MPHKNHEQNRKLWNETVDIHFNHPDYRVKEFLEGATTLKPIELREVGDVTGKTLLHPFCQFGLDTFSWARRGAIITGVDISDRSIERANELKERSGIEGRFIRSDILDLPDVLDEQFDIVFQSHGTLHWLSDIPKWAEVVARYVKPGGFFYIVDLHPYADVVEENRSYFDKSPQIYKNERDYTDKDYICQNESVECQFQIGEVVSSLIASGLTLEFLHEFEECCYDKEKDWVKKGEYYYPPDGPAVFPMMFSLKASKSK